MTAKLNDLRAGVRVVSTGIEGLADGPKVVRADQAGNFYLFCPASKRRHYLNEMAKGDAISGLEKV